MDLVDEGVQAAVVHVRVDAASGGEAGEHGLGVDGPGEATGRGGLGHDGEQPAPPASAGAGLRCRKPPSGRAAVPGPGVRPPLLVPAHRSFPRAAWEKRVSW